VIGEAAIDFARRAGLIDESGVDLADCRVVQSMGKVLALGLSAKEVEELDVKLPMLRAICEYARLDPDQGLSECAVEAVDATLKVIAEQINNLDMEIEMLRMRKSALKKRTKALEKLAASLRESAHGAPWS